MTRRTLLVLVLISIPACASRGDRGSTSGADARVASVPHIDPALLAGFRYRMIGPHRGGRSTAVSGVAGDHRTFYMGAAGGGVWKTTDAGDVWENVSDASFKAGSIGAIGVAPSNPDIVYVGTGSACIRNNVSVGIGMYKSTDAGATWQPAGLEDAGQIARVRVDPRDPNLVYVAALGHAFGPNTTRGVFRSRDGGRTWERVLFVNDRTGAVDLSMDARNPRVIYAAMWTGVRQPWALIGGSTEGGVFKTTDGGDHWSRLSGGLPAGPVGRIGVAVSPATPNRVWALVDAADGGVFRSDDAGRTFHRTNDERRLTGRSWYYAHIFADTKDANTVYVGNTDFFRSTDGGTTFAPIPMPHGDNHDLWIDPQDARVMIEGNDGGATISIDGGRSWSTQLNQPTAEMYRVVVDDRVPYRVYGAQQDQYDALSVPSRTANFGARLQLQHWYAVGGMEGGFVALDPRNPDVVYAGGPGGMLTRFDRGEMHLRGIDVWPQAATGSINLKYRFAWNAPIFVSPLEPNVVYHASQVVHRSADGGQTWTAISGDLTRNDRTKQASPAGAVGPELMAYPTISAFEESKLTRGVLWTGSDDGLVHLSRDGGDSWTDVTPKAMPEWATVNAIDPSPHNAGRAFLTVFKYQLDDFRPYVFRTDDYGRNWTLLTDGTNGIPATAFVRVVREDPVRKGLLYAGTEFGMYVSFDDGAHWQSLQLNLPATPITDIAIHDDDLVLSTNGRSFWILDDISPLRELALQPPTAPHVFAPRATYRIATSADEDDQPYVGGACCVSNPRDLYAGARIERHRLGEEPPDGAIVYAAFPQVPADRVVLDVIDANGRLVRTLADTGQSATTEGAAPRLAAGLNRFAWDLRAEPAGPPAPGLRGPKAVPGTYRIRLTVGGAPPQTVPLRLLGDPRLHLDANAYQEQFTLLTEIADAIARVRAATASAGGRAPRGDTPPPLLQELTTLYTFVAASEDRPTTSAMQRWHELQQALNQSR